MWSKLPVEIKAADKANPGGKARHSKESQWLLANPRLTRWIQWVDATLRSNQTCMENKG